MDSRNIDSLYNFTSIYLTTECNNKCYFCFHGDNRYTSTPTETILYQLQILSANFNPHILLTGGEPTIHKDFFKIVKATETLHFEGVYLESNGRRFSDPSFCDTMMNYKINSYYISLQSPNKEAQSFITNVEESYAQTIKGISNLVSRKQDVIIQTLITRSNFYDLGDMVELANILKVKQIKFLSPVSMGYAQEIYSSLIVPIDIVKEPLQEAIRLAHQYNINLDLGSLSLEIM